jgi:hypothetical protein
VSAPPPFTLAYVAGAGRSGSTLLERLLGQIPGVCAAGEITLSWVRGFRENQLCGCGTPFRECAFWREVTRLAFGGMEAFDPEPALALRDALCRMHHIPRFASPALRSRAFQDRLTRYGEILRRLYHAIHQVSGARVIVDSSKYPPEAWLLRALPGLRLSVIHLVRHSNAVAYAWQKRLVRPDVHWTTAYMPRYPFLKTTIAWNVFNVVIELLGRRGVPSFRVRYEDLVARPGEIVAGAARFLGLDPAGTPFIRGNAADFTPNHTASGNPVRFATGAVALRLDREWEGAAPAVQRAIVTALTFPLLRRYGYR